ncbi:LacI family transcriptional regulator [Parafrankia soli]|uniref:LacI family transcriptional regulator n=1 Tax=Parafrankia soli TaxID=2599596 RepID=A0A1S1RKQ9_9ACTN|nr:LacI family transcriptional regulator [Parafrankia soli]
MAVSEATAKRRVTATDVAAVAGVSRATVGFVLNRTRGQTISEGTRERVLEAALRLGYRPNSAAQALASGRSRIVLFVLPDWPVEYSFRIYLDEASRVLDEAGYSLVTYTRRPHGETRPLWELLTPDSVFGFTSFSPDEIASMRGCGIRRIFPDPARQEPLDLSLAVSAGPRLQVEHLYEHGRRQLAYAAFADPLPSSLVQARHDAARERAHSLDLPPVDIRYIDYRDGSADDAVRAWHGAGVTGVVAFNDDVAAAVVSAAIRIGIRIPDDLAVIGHDDSPIATMFVPALSTVRFDTATLGRGFAEYAINQTEGRPLPDWRPPVSAILVRREST